LRPGAPKLGRLRLEDQDFEASLGYMTIPCLKQINKIIGNLGVENSNNHVEKLTGRYQQEL
jgi:hypothetical protein